MFLRMTFPSTPPTRVIPLAFPTTILSTSVLSFVPGATRPIPKLLPCVAYPFPLVRFARSRLRLLPFSHMPPQGTLTLPFRTAMFSSISLSEPAVTIIPAKQLVETVTKRTSTRVL